MVYFSRFPLFCNDKIQRYIRFFRKFPGVIFVSIDVAYTPFDSLISSGGDSDLKSMEPWFSSFERNLPIPPIYCLRFKRMEPSHGTIQPHLKSFKVYGQYSLCIDKFSISRFPLICPWYFSKFSWYFHDWKSYCHFSSFQGAVGTLTLNTLLYENFTCMLWCTCFGTYAMPFYRITFRLHSDDVQFSPDNLTLAYSHIPDNLHSHYSHKCMLPPLTSTYG